jgi:Ca2+/Na+ antiporter
VAWIWGLGLAVILTGGMVFADFCIVDDWLVTRWLGPGDGLPFSRIWPALLETEVGGFGAAGRFRPIFFLHLELETWLFGDQPSLYRALRVLYFGLFLGAAGRIAVRCIGLLPALALVAGIAGLGFWSNVWSRSLGPAEQPAVLGIALFLLACDTIVPRFVSGGRIPGWALPVASIGVAIAAGSKENFVFLLAVLCPMALMMAVTRRLSPISTILALLIVALLVVYVLHTLAGNSQDFYGADNSVTHRLTAMLALPRLAAQPFLVPFALAAFGLAVPLAVLAHCCSPLPLPQRQRAIVVFLGFTGFLALYELWELFFYNGRLPSGIRYDFPILLLPLAIALGFAAFTGYALPPGGGRRWRSVQFTFLALTTLYLYHFRPTFSLPAAVIGTVARTTEFRRAFHGIQMAVSEHPDWPIILEPNRPWDFEAVYAFNVLQRFFGVTNPLLLRVEVAPKANHDTFEQWLTDQMRTWATVGLPGTFQPLPDPASLAGLDGHCFGIGYWRPIVSPCTPLEFRPKSYLPRG